MRAAQTALRRPMLPRPCSAEHSHKAQETTGAKTALWFGTAFLVGYLPGIWLGRGGTSALGRQMAAYYAKNPETDAFSVAFGAKFSVSFLQLCAVFLCGFCVFGVGLLTVLFVARGVFLGYCAASVAAANGAAGIVQYRLNTALSDMTTLFLCLWLACCAEKLAAELFSTVRGRPTRGTPAAARWLTVRFLEAVVLSAVFGAVGAFLIIAVKVGN